MPVGTEIEEPPLIVAVKMTSCPGPEGLAEEVNTTEVALWTF